MVDNDAVFINMEMAEIKAQFREHIQKTILEHVDGLGALLPYFKATELEAAELDYQIEAAPNGLYPNLTFPIKYFRTTTPEDWVLAIIPHLDIKAFGKNQEEMEANLKETIGFHLNSFFESQQLEELLPFVWNSNAHLEVHPIEISLSPLNQKNNQSFEQTKFLKKIGHIVRLKSQTAFEQEQLVNQMLQALKSRVQKNILVVGPSQSGKTALIWQVIFQLNKRKTSPVFIETTAAALIRELSSDDHWRVNVKILIDELEREGCILYIRNWIEMFEVGKSINDNISLGEYLYRYIESGKIQLISECTAEQFSKIEIIKPGFRQFFQLIKNPQPQGKLLRKIVYAKVKSIAKEKGIAIREDAIDEVIRLNKRFAPYAGMPGKAIQFLERIIHNHFLLQKSSKTKKEWVNKKHIIKAFSEETGIPLLIIDPTVPFDSERIIKQFKKELFGQDEAIHSIVDVLAIVKSAMTNLNKPISSFLFVGPTGVGKTELAKILSGFIFSDRRRMIRFDMSEFSTYDSILKLLGTEHQAGLLAATIRKNPFSVLLFDEIEKAHSKFNEILLQILEEGRLTDGTGVEVNFCSAIIIMTSNIGAAKVTRPKPGFNKNDNLPNIKDALLREIRKHFAPEVFNRIDHSVVFYPITKDIAALIVDRELRKIKHREGLKYRKTNIQIHDDAVQLLAQKGFNPDYGARNIQRKIREEIIIPLSKQLNQFDEEEHLNVKIYTCNNQIEIETKDDELSLDLLLEEIEIVDLAAEASLLRQEITKILNSYIYYQLKGKEEQLINKSDKTHDEAKTLVQIMELTQRTQVLFEKTQQIETELSLAALKLGNYRPKIEQELEVLNTKLSNIKRQIVATAYPENNRHHLFFYGAALDRIVPVYSSILEKLGFKMSLKTIWHFSKQQSALAKNNIDPQKNQALIEDTYLVMPGWEKPALKSATLHGVRLTIEGACAYYYLANEHNVQEWLFSDGKVEKIVISNTNLEQIKIPGKIHKLDFYKQKIPNYYILDSANKEASIRLKQASSNTPISTFWQEKWEQDSKNSIAGEFH